MADLAFVFGWSYREMAQMEIEKLLAFHGKALDLYQASRQGPQQ